MLIISTLALTPGTIKLNDHILTLKGTIKAPLCIAKSKQNCIHKLKFRVEEESHAS